MALLRALLPLFAGMIAVLTVVLAIELEPPQPIPSGAEVPELVLQDGPNAALPQVELWPLAPPARSSRIVIAFPLCARAVFEPEPSTPPPRDRLDTEPNGMS